MKTILPKPNWIKIKPPADYNKIKHIKSLIRKNGLHSVCEEASCPNLYECFNRGTATFIILGNICTRRCQFCDISHGRPNLPSPDEPIKLAETIKDLKLKYVVITSVNRDDLHDGGAKHFVNCINAIRNYSPNIKIEILVPDFRNCINQAVNIFTSARALPDVFNHNIENVPRLYSKIRPGANYQNSLNLLSKFKQINPKIPTKSGLMLGLGEEKEEIMNVMHDLRIHGVTMLTVGQYLQPSRYHLSVKRYVSITEFEEIKKEAISMGFTHVASGPFVRSSYHAEFQFNGI